METQSICKYYVIYEKFSSQFYWMISITVILYNSIFYAIVVPIVQLVGFYKKSDE